MTSLEVTDAARKRKWLTLTPSPTTSDPGEGLQALSHFLAQIESSNNRFNLRDAMRSAFIIQHAEQGVDLDFKQADNLARSKLRTIRRLISTDDRQSFGSTPCCAAFFGNFMHTETIA